MTNKILSYEIDIPISLKDKHHKAEKPVTLYKYLIKNLTLEGDIVLDQFAGSCNILKASIETNRTGIAIENNTAFINKAIEKFNLKEEK